MHIANKSACMAILKMLHGPAECPPGWVLLWRGAHRLLAWAMLAEHLPCMCLGMDSCPLQTSRRLPTTNHKIFLAVIVLLAPSRIMAVQTADLILDDLTVPFLRLFAMPTRDTRKKTDSCLGQRITWTQYATFSTSLPLFGAWHNWNTSASCCQKDCCPFFVSMVLKKLWTFLRQCFAAPASGLAS